MFPLLLDSDVIFKDVDFPLETLAKDMLKSRASIMMSPCNPTAQERKVGGCNSGHIFVRNTPIAMQLLDDWWHLGDVGEPLAYLRHSMLRDQSAFNAGILKQKQYLDAFATSEHLEPNGRWLSHSSTGRTKNTLRAQVRGKTSEWITNDKHMRDAARATLMTNAMTDTWRGAGWLVS